MSRTTLPLLCSSLLAAAGVVSLDLASRAAAQGRSPLLETEAVGPRPAPAWRNTSWLNTDRPVTLESQRGRVVLLNFWVFTCYNCTNTVPSLVDLDRKYRDAGLTIIGVHTPEFPPYSGEHDRGNVERALARYGIPYPNAQDNDSRTWNLYRVRFWPSFVLIDKRGRIRYEGAGEFHLGDANYRLWEDRIRELLAES
jgi:thiol-disulfide isomerase/thioredoxin